MKNASCGLEHPKKYHQAKWLLDIPKVTPLSCSGRNCRHFAEVTWFPKVAMKSWLLWRSRYAIYAHMYCHTVDMYEELRGFIMCYLYV